MREKEEREKEKFLIERIWQHKDLAITAKEAGKYIGRSATTWKLNGNEEMAKWIQQKSDRLYNMSERYEGKAAEASSELHKINCSSDPMMYRWRRLQIGGGFSDAAFSFGASWQSVFVDWNQTSPIPLLICFLWNRSISCSSTPTFFILSRRCWMLLLRRLPLVDMSLLENGDAERSEAQHIFACIFRLETNYAHCKLCSFIFWCAVRVSAVIWVF